MTKIVIVLILLTKISLSAAPAAACAVPATYHIPTTIELVEQADAIVLARVGGSHADRKSGLIRADLTPISLLKGQYLSNIVSLEGAILANNKHHATPSDPRNLVDANPDAFSGGCNRNVFNKDAIVVAFLRVKNGEWVIHAPAFSRALEDVRSSDALWVKTVRLYIRIASLPIAQRRHEMLSEVARLSRENMDPDSPLLALDLKRALSVGY
ncbi:hypothetical protein [Novosphingobium sp. AP12]|uniref:hypothetical protein n=1 Tax=Novosphingobium sp. AP12 TaxID=1144305 RepID=UPI0012FC1694|nr:hypothetical protein [Novosphingobium sp. AP12]